MKPWMQWMAVAALLVAGAAGAAPPPREVLVYHGQGSWFTLSGAAAMPVPPSPQLQALRAQPRCRAAAGPQPHWAILGDQLYLTHFSDCTGDIALGAVYDGVTAPLVATWISGELKASYGTILCYTVRDGAVADTALRFTVEHGYVTSVDEDDNSGACPER